MIRAETDVLVLGAGLAGLRAAQAAREAAPDISVLSACLRPGPAGSSFANRNDALGIQVPLTDEERDAFVHEVLELADPGFVRPELVRIMAGEARERFRELWSASLDFRRREGTLQRFAGCGSGCPRSFVFDGLRQAHAKLENRVRLLGGMIDADLDIRGLTVEDGVCTGAWGLNGAGKPVAIRARSVVMALGGSAPLYEHRVCGPANRGISLALLHGAGCDIANAGYMQFLWHDRHGAYINPAGLTKNGRTILHQGKEHQPDFAPELLTTRYGHCPTFPFHEDAVIDRWLLERAEDDGFVRVRTHEGMVEAAPMAHAGNGGAIVDERGATTVPNLFAAGECATGMHGAQRIGGAMVLACLVFGRRAGIAAAQQARKSEMPQGLPSVQLPDQDRDEAAERAVREVMRRHLGPFPDKLRELLDTLDNVRASGGLLPRLMARSSQIMAKTYLTDPV
jgi:succinate dehydrogenase/fumarate reductase flavoprotein subunit